MKREIQRNKKIEELYSKGYSLFEIAKEFGISRERVRQILKEIERDRKELKRLSRLREKGAF